MCIRDSVQQLAVPGTVWVTEHTARLVDGFFALRDRGTPALKGVSVPVRVYELAAAGRAVGVVGDAGVGKSRVCLEFVERCRAQGLTVHEAHCPAHGATIPL